jgi:hypothetical protein
MRMRAWACWSPVALTFCAGAIYGHHSITGTYDLSREVTIEGAITKFEFINPHPFVTVAVGLPRGERKLWRIEMDNRFELAQVGVVSGTLKPGDRVTVTGNPGRSQSQVLYIRTLDRPADGLRIEQNGSTPSIQFGRDR